MHDWGQSERITPQGQRPTVLRQSKIRERTRTRAATERGQYSVDVEWSETDLDRVLRGEADKALVAAQGGGEAEKGQVVAGIAFVSRAESAVAG